MRQPSTPTLASLLSSFFRDRLVAQRRASHETVTAYRNALRLLLVFVSQRVGRPPSRLTIEDLDQNAVLAYLDHLEKERGNSIRTRNTRLAAIRSFYHYVAYSDPSSMVLVQQVLSIPTKRAPKPALQYLGAEELRALLRTPDRNTPLGRRDYALLLFLARTGARVSETVGINAADLRLDSPRQVLIRGKGAKERVVPLSDDLASVLHALCVERSLDPAAKAPVFVNVRDNRLTRFGVIHILKRTAIRASQIEPLLASRTVFPHLLRHTAAMNLLQSGVDLTTIQSWLGHVSIDTTHCYVEADLEMKHRALQKCTTTPTEFALYQPTDELLALLDSL